VAEDQVRASGQKAPARLIIDADAMRLDDILALAARAAGQPVIDVDAPGLADRRLTGRFDVSDPAVLARRLAVALGLQVHRTSDRLVLIPAP
jgi:ferric-dicitrate binding protein FerR (iron transport regulator)